MQYHISENIIVFPDSLRVLNGFNTHWSFSVFAHCCFSVFIFLFKQPTSHYFWPIHSLLITQIISANCQPVVTNSQPSPFLTCFQSVLFCVCPGPIGCESLFKDQFVSAPLFLSFFSSALGLWWKKESDGVTPGSILNLCVFFHSNMQIKESFCCW